MIRRPLCVVFALVLCACSSEPAKEQSKETAAPAPKPAAAELWTEQ